MSLGETIEFLRVFRKQAKHSDDLYSESEPRALLSSFFLRFSSAEKLKDFTKTKYQVENLMLRTFSNFK